MCDKGTDGMTTEELLEALVKLHKEKIEELLKAQENVFKDQEKAFAERLNPMKEKAGDAMNSLFGLFFNAEIQKHFVKAGMEFFAGLEELIKNAPFPEGMKENVEKACETEEEVIRDVAKDLSAEPKQKKKTKKIDVE